MPKIEYDEDGELIKKHPNGGDHIMKFAPQKTGPKDKDNELLTAADKLAISIYIKTNVAAQACREAYPERWQYLQKTASQYMKQLIGRPAAQDFIDQMQADIERKIEISKDEIIAEAWAISQAAKNNLDFSSAIKGLFLLSKMCGYMSKLQIDVNKNININFGGNFNPAIAPDQQQVIDITGDVVNEQEEKLFFPERENPNDETQD